MWGYNYPVCKKVYRLRYKITKNVSGIEILLTTLSGYWSCCLWVLNWYLLYYCVIHNLYLFIYTYIYIRIYIHIYVYIFKFNCRHISHENILTYMDTLYMVVIYRVYELMTGVHEKCTSEWSERVQESYIAESSEYSWYVSIIQNVFYILMWHWSKQHL